MAYLLDTDTASFYLRGDAHVQARYNATDPDQLAVSRVTLAELLTLAEGRTSPTASRAHVEAFASAMRFLEVDEAAWVLLPAVKSKLIAAGRPLGDSGNFDILQAAVAYLHGVTLVTHNVKHYEAIGQFLPITVEDWAPHVGREASPGTVAPPGDFPSLSGTPAQRASRLLGWLAGRLGAGEPWLLTYRWAHAKLIGGASSAWLPSHATEVVELASGTWSYNFAGLADLRLDSFIVSAAERQPGEGHWQRAPYSAAAWRGVFGHARVLGS